MIARRHKLLAASAVLALGVLAAWPLRRREPLVSGGVRAAPEQTASTPQLAQVNPPLKVQSVSNAGVMTLQPASKASNSLTPLAGSSPMIDQSLAERIHVVHEGDSLERLARRYLEDAGRAMEIFELNRQVLTNPHLLPLGAELRIPAKDRLPEDRSASGGKDVK